MPVGAKCGGAAALIGLASLIVEMCLGASTFMRNRTPKPTQLLQPTLRRFLPPECQKLHQYYCITSVLEVETVTIYDAESILGSMDDILSSCIDDSNYLAAK